NNMTKDDVEIVEFPYPDNWYNDPKMLAPMNNPTDLWAARDHKHYLAFRPLETALLEGKWMPFTHRVRFSSICRKIPVRSK
ncbi:hypothetical protein, partial [Lutimonas sp.]|uniref:hypothetical protein n=1 Tax=Lutimonas sp. TaxID=1872403 RepID=UPI003C78C3E6